MIRIAEDSTVEMSSPEKNTQDSLLMLTSWLFLVGSILFQIDAVIELLEGFSIHVGLHLLAGFLFTIGSILFVVDGARKA
ncbi:hypothetical protein S7335_847 [Synechococcus sp. PCC 7335]|uniref:hypothetical protein n=1 Tax=Synechococcus sp. (strain ATCC 29403 / PCC 7335) TaxID=91464 RepID=UPI00017EC0DC|nr:hypothetical protein [Synechococcus sp. PCC 7335]EDX82401.1 hypothetical protein S7335_847 [Synechococcus sp. PCC 7335]